MKIMVITNSISGLYRFRKMLLEKLKDEGHQLHCVAPPANRYIKELGEICSVHEVKINRRGVNPLLDAKHEKNVKILRALKVTLNKYKL